MVIRYVFLSVSTIWTVKYCQKLGIFKFLFLFRLFVFVTLLLSSIMAYKSIHVRKAWFVTWSERRIAHYSCTLFSYFTVTIYIFSFYTFSFLHFFHTDPFPCCTFLCSNLFMLHFFPLYMYCNILCCSFTDCNVFVLHPSPVALFSCWNCFLLHFCSCCVIPRSAASTATNISDG